MSLVRFAVDADEEALTDIFAGHLLGLAGDIDEHVLLSGEDGSVLGGAMLSCWDEARFHLEVLGIKDTQCGKAYGNILLKALLQAPRLYCRRIYGNTETGPANDAFVMTTVSRGRAQPFYERHGFVRCTFGDLQEYYADQCAVCSDRESCMPAPMILRR